MRLLHTMLRVGNLEQSIAFYTEVLGMRLLRKDDFPSGKFTLAFVGYGDEATGSVIELTHNWETTAYDLGNGFGHIALEVDDVYQACEAIKARGGKITREAGPMLHGSRTWRLPKTPTATKSNCCRLHKSLSPNRSPASGRRGGCSCSPLPLAGERLGERASLLQE